MIDKSNQTLEELSLNIIAACKMDSQYNPSKDIESFIQNLPKPDILIVKDLGGTPIVYCNNREALGTVLQYDLSNPELKRTEPAVLKGDASAWTNYVLGLPDQMELSKFLENFIERHTYESFFVKD